MQEPANQRETLGGRASILVVDDDPLVRAWLRKHLRSAGHAVIEAASVEQARQCMRRRRPELLLLDRRLPDADGMTLLRELKAQGMPAAVILFTGDPSVDLAVDAMSQGADYFMAKPLSLDKLLARIELALKAGRRRRFGSPRESGVSIAPEQLVARSVAMLEVKALLEKIAGSPASTVLLTGDSGVGKDAAARFLHGCSARVHKPFVNITCSALPDNLLESELFGHERGAFTDAKQRKSGLLEEADGGSVFLDEIGEMVPALQAKLLRFLEDKTFRRVGGAADIRPDVRVIAATNRDLRQAVRDGRFRQDLYYRLAVMHVHIPPLCERPEDIELLGRHFVARYSELFNKALRGLTPAAVDVLCEHDWPGNVRELKNVIERAALLAEGEEIGVADIVIERETELARGARLLELPRGGLKLDQLEQELLLQALERTRGNKTRAAVLLGLTRDQIRHRIEKYRLQELELEGE